MAIPIRRRVAPGRRAGRSPAHQDDYLDRGASKYVLPELDPRPLRALVGRAGRQASTGGSARRRSRPRSGPTTRGSAASAARQRGRRTAPRSSSSPITAHEGPRAGRPGRRAGARPGSGGRPGRPTPPVDAGVQLSRAAVDGLPRLVAFLRDQPWCGPVFVRDDRSAASLAGALPASTLWGGASGRGCRTCSSRRPGTRSKRTSTACRAAPLGIPGPGRELTAHGSLARATHEQHDCRRRSRRALGPRPRHTGQAPLTLHPTILHLLGLPLGDQMQGRISSRSVRATPSQRS